ncbi:MAG: leucine-rich repeat domain-containing protein, partial [Helicobacter sp.]|nr:leucine-rich repeat domain-containing protein [Helicobacter sp.]
VSTRNSSNNRYKDFISVFSFTPINETECDVRLSDKTATYAIIPDKVELNGKEYTVTVVAANGFSAASKLELVRIPDSVKTIGSNAFVNCKALTSITLPAVETIGSNAFAMTKLDYLIIPTTVTSVASTILRSTDTQVYVRASLNEGATTLEGWSSNWNGSILILIETKFKFKIRLFKSLALVV